MPFTHWSTIYSIFSKVGFARSFLCSFSHISWFHSKLHEINIHTPTHNYIKLDVHEVLECKDTSPAFWTRSSSFYETRTRTTKLSQTPRTSWWAGTQSGSAFDKNCDHSFVACSRLQMLHAPALIAKSERLEFFKPLETFHTETKHWHSKWPYGGVAHMGSYYGPRGGWMNEWMNECRTCMSWFQRRHQELDQ